jgi:hypothetical protein
MKSILEHVGVRIDPATIARIDALVPLFSTKAREATRSDLLRIVILAGLQRLERDPEGTTSELTGLV